MAAKFIFNYLNLLFLIKRFNFYLNIFLIYIIISDKDEDVIN